MIPENELHTMLVARGYAFLVSIWPPVTLDAVLTRKVEMAFVGSSHVDAENWITKLMVAAYEMADEIMIDSAEDNALRTSYSSVSEKGISIPQADYQNR